MAPLPSMPSPTPGSPLHMPEFFWAKTRGDGKPGISVRDHSLNVGSVAEALVATLSGHAKPRVPRGAVTLAALHDVGKISAGFAAKCEAWLVAQHLVARASQQAWRVRCEADHAKISQFTVQKLLPAGLCRWGSVLGAHHGHVKPERIPRIAEDAHDAWEAARRRLAEELIRIFGPLPHQAADEATLWLVAGLVTVADWIGSDESRFPHDAVWNLDERRGQACRAVAGIGGQPIAARPGLSFGDLFPEYAPNGLQEAVIQTVGEPGVYVIEGPMGCGKTEAALAAGYHLLASGKAGGVYFALPTQVTSNRIFQRVRHFMDRALAAPAEVHLLHGSSWLVDTTPPPTLRAAAQEQEARDHVRAGRSWFASGKRAMLAPFGVGTVDQALLGVVAATHFFVRQFGLAGKVVILDEVHSYDLYTGTLLDVLVRRLLELQCTVVILSATLTGERRRELLQSDQATAGSVGYPLLSCGPRPVVEIPCPAGPEKRVGVKFTESSDLIEEVLERAGRDQCVVWIRNTVDGAQETFRRVKSANKAGGPAVALLHSRFPFSRREELESYWMEALGKDGAKRPRGCVLVSTQVVEQSVDIDADLLVTDLAPTDMLLQRLGRLWRHERKDRAASCSRPEIWIGAPREGPEQLRTASAPALRELLGKSARVYAPYVLLRSLEQWRDRSTLRLPADIRPILEATYAPPSAGEPAGWHELREQMERRKEEMRQQAINATRIWNNPSLPDEEEVQTRYGTCPTAHLLLVLSLERVDRISVRLALVDGTRAEVSGRTWSLDAAKALHRNLVRVPRWCVAERLSNPPGWLAEHVHRPGLAARVAADGRLLGSESDADLGLSYHPDEGVVIRRKAAPRRVQEELDESYD